MSKLHFQLSYLKAKASGFDHFAAGILSMYRQSYPNDFL